MSKRDNLKEDKSNPIQQKLLGANISDIDLEKYRKTNKDQAQQYQINGKLSPEILKQVSGKFSLEIIFSIDISRQNLTVIKELQNCINLAFLDLSNNKISDLSPIQNLKEMQFLALRSNLIEDLKPLIDLKKIVNLQLQGNKIESIYQIDHLSCIDNLKTLYLQTASQDEQNPVCKSDNYRDVVYETIKGLGRLDGLPKNMKEIPTAKELEMPKDLQPGQDDNYWYSNNYTANKPSDDFTLKADIRKMENQFQNHIINVKLILDQIDKTLKS